jgi:cysteate synthase
MSLRLSQNRPFLPIYNAWQKKSRDIEPIQRRKPPLEQPLYAKVLANRKPPYGPVGGLYDVRWRQPATGAGGQ